MPNAITLELRVDDKGSLVIKDFNKAYDKAMDRMKSSTTAASRTSVSAFDKMKSGLAKVRQHWIAITAAIAAVTLTIKKSLNEFKDFETALVDMGKVTSRSLGLIRKEIMVLPSILGSATELMKGYYQVISAGVTDPVASMNLLVEAAKAAKAAHVDQAEVIKGLTKVMAGYGGEIKNVATAADLLFRIEKEGQTTVGELIPVIGGLAKMSHETGVSIDEMGGALALITQTAGDTAEAATQYRMVLMALLKPMGALEKALKALHYESGVAMIKELGLVETFRTLTKYMKENNIAVGDMFESQRGLLGLLSLMDRDFETFNDKIKSMADKAGMADKAFQEWKKTFAATGEVFRNTIGKVLIEFGEEIAPTVQQAMKDISDAITKNKEDIIKYLDDVGKKVETFYEILKKLKSFSDTFPGGALEWGIIGFLLFKGKTQAAAIVAALVTINEGMKTFDMNLGSLSKHDLKFWESIRNIWDVITGKRDINTGAIILSQKELAELAELTAASQQKMLDAFEKTKPVIDDVTKSTKDLNEENFKGIEITKEMEEAYQDTLKALEKYVAIKRSLEEGMADRIFELTHNETEIRIRELDKQVEALRYHKIEEDDINKWYSFEIQKINEESTQKAIDQYNEQVDAWNSGVDRMVSTWKDVFIATVSGEFDGLAERIEQSFKDMLATMVVDWIASMFKMQKASDLNINISGTGTMGGTTGRNGRVGSEIGTVAGKIISKNIISSITNLFTGMAGAGGIGATIGQAIPYIGTGVGIYNAVSGDSDKSTGRSIAEYGTLIGWVLSEFVFNNDTKRRRQAKGGMFTEGMSGWGLGQYGSLGEMMGAQPSYLRSPKYLHYAQSYKNAPGGGLAYGLQERLTGLHEVTAMMGGDSAAAAGKLDTLSSSMDAFYNIIKKGSPEGAKKLKEMQANMEGLFKQDILESFAQGTISLRNVRKELQDMGMEDAATMAQLYEQALANLFNNTMPLGTVQLERLYEDIKQLKEDMEEAQSIAAGWDVVMRAMANGLELTGEQLELLRSNIDNLKMMEYIDIYEAMGIDQITLAAKDVDDFEDRIDAMRESLDKASVAGEQFKAWAEGLPDALGDVKAALMVVSAAIEYMNNLMKEMVDVIENLGNREDVFEGLQKALDAGDLGAVTDSLMEINIMLNDMVEVTSMLSGIIPLFKEWNYLLLGTSMILQSVISLIQGFQIFAMMLSFIIDVIDKAAELSDTIEEWTKLKNIILQAIFNPLLMVLDLFGEFIPFFQGLSAIIREFLDNLFNKDKLEDQELDLEEMLKRLRAISEQTFMAMTVDIANYFKDFGKSTLELNLESLQQEFEGYMDYLAEHWEDIPEELREKIKDNIIPYYEKMIEDMFDQFIEQFEDFQLTLKRDLQEMSPEGRTGEDIGADMLSTWWKMDEALREGDYEEWLNQAGEMRGLILERYEMEKQKLAELEAVLERIGEFANLLKRDINDVIMEEARYAFAIAKTATERAAALKLIESAYDAQIEQAGAGGGEAYFSMLRAIEEGDFNTAMDNAEKLREIMLEKYELEKNKIKEVYGVQIAEMEKTRDAWKSVFDSISDQILALKTGPANPADVFERIEEQMTEIERLRGAMAGAETEAERAGYAGELASALGAYLTMAEGAYSRPSLEYQEIYAAVLAELEALKTEAETKVSFAESEIIRLNDEMNTKLGDLAEQLKIDLAWLSGITDDMKGKVETEIKETNIILTEIEGWLRGLYEETGLIIGELGTVKDDYIKKMKEYFNLKMEDWGVAKIHGDLDKNSPISTNIVDMSTYLKKLSAPPNYTSKYDDMISYLKDIALNTGIFGGLPRHHEGNFQVPYTGYKAELSKGEVILTNEQYRNQGTSISFGNITVHAAPGADGKQILKTIKDGLIEEIRYGDLGKWIKEENKNVA